MRAILLSVGLVLAAGAAQAEDMSSEPRPGVTRNEAEAAFGKAVLLSCMSALEQQRPIADLPPEYRADLRPALDTERWMSVSKDKSVPVWASLTWGGHMTLTETAADRCDVYADQMPVEETLTHAMKAIGLARPDWREVPQRPDYNPFVYQIEGDHEGAHYVVHFEGAEPGAPGHAYRFSLLHATVTRKAIP